MEKELRDKLESILKKHCLKPSIDSIGGWEQVKELIIDAMLEAYNLKPLVLPSVEEIESIFLIDNENSGECNDTEELNKANQFRQEGAKWARDYILSLSQPQETKEDVNIKTLSEKIVDTIILGWNEWSKQFTSRVEADAFWAKLLFKTQGLKQEELDNLYKSHLQDVSTLEAQVKELQSKLDKANKDIILLTTPVKCTCKRMSETSSATITCNGKCKY